MSILIRPYRNTDTNFVKMHWHTGLRFGNRALKQFPKDQVDFIVNDAIQKAMSRPQLQINMACLEDDPDALIGFLIFEENCLYWIFVREEWRKMGIAKKLLIPQITTFIYSSDMGLIIIHKHKIKLKPKERALNEY